MTEIDLVRQARERRAATESFNEALVRKVFVAQSHVCVGLDPDSARLSDAHVAAVAHHLAGVRVPREDQVVENLGRDAAAKYLTCQSVMLAARRHAVAFKPNVAFFEGDAAGAALMPAVAEFCASAAPDALRICDAKRGDIGNTAEQYAHAVFEVWGYDAVTVNPLMGTDCVEPFLKIPSRGAFLLCLTSNPGASDFLLKNDLYLRIAEKAMEWNRLGNVGLVVGATRPEWAARVREVAPDLPFLIPGVGAQGGSLAETLDAIDARRNPRFLINASRAIMFPGPEALEAAGGDYGLAVTEAARKLREEINTLIGETAPGGH